MDILSELLILGQKVDALVLVVVEDKPLPVGDALVLTRVGADQGPLTVIALGLNALYVSTGPSDLLYRVPDLAQVKIVALLRASICQEVRVVSEHLVLLDIPACLRASFILVH